MANGNKTYPHTNSHGQFSMELKTILKKLIKERGITITHLSRSTKVPLQTLHGWLHGSEPKSLRQVKAVADSLGVDLDYLCFGIKSRVDKRHIGDFEDEINAGIFEVVLRRIKK
jgi:transcriptional regulator with XRE-family HTH domain